MGHGGAFRNTYSATRVLCIQAECDRTVTNHLHAVPLHPRDFSSELLDLVQPESTMLVVGSAHSGVTVARDHSTQKEERELKP